MRLWVAALLLEVRRAPGFATTPPPQRGAKHSAPSHAVNAFVSCSVQDALHVVQKSGEALAEMFAAAAEDLALIQRQLVADNMRGGQLYPVLSADMCCCNTAGWQELRSTPWSGFHDCDNNRLTEIFYGNTSLNDVFHVFTGNRTIDTDLAWVSPASTTMPGVVDLQQDGLYVAAWLRTTGEVWNYYPPFRKTWPGHYLGDQIGAEYEGIGEIFIQVTLPEHNPTRALVWTAPYEDSFGSGDLISMVGPIYFDGPFRGHVFRDEFVGTVGIDMQLDFLEAFITDLRPTPGSLPMVLDIDGRLVGAPQDVVEAIFGLNVTLHQMLRCGDQGKFVQSGGSGRALPCSSIAASSTGDWRLLLDAINQAPLGMRTSTDSIYINRAGQPIQHVGVFYRWPVEGAPNWTSVVLVPQQELAQQNAHWAAPASIEGTVYRADGATEDLGFSLQNVGTLNLTFRLESLPEWVTIIKPALNETGRERALPLPANARVDFVVVLDAAKAEGRGVSRSKIIWALTDDGYPDCDVVTQAVTEVTLTVQIASQEWLVMGVLGGILGALALGFCVQSVQQRRRELQRFRMLQRMQEQQQMQTIKSVVKTMAFPIHLVTVEDFLGLAELERHEVLRKRKQLTIVDLIKDLNSVLYFLLSHQWTGYEDPDHTGSQFAVMRRTVRFLSCRFGWSPTDSYVWVDYCSIPQDHSKMQELAILSLPVYAAYATAFVIVAPTVMHQEGNEVCNLESYMTRAWCRAEQMSHIASQGIHLMFMATDEGIAAADEEMLKSALRVFEGTMTCCRLKHRHMVRCDKEQLVLPILGVYARMLRVSKDTSQLPEKQRQSLLKVMRLIESAGEKNVFPAEFDFETEHGVERRELCGDLMQKVSEQSLNADAFDEEGPDEHCLDSSTTALEAHALEVKDEWTLRGRGIVRLDDYNPTSSISASDEAPLTRMPSGIVVLPNGSSCSLRLGFQKLKTISPIKSEPAPPPDLPA